MEAVFKVSGSTNSGFLGRGERVLGFNCEINFAFGIGVYILVPREHVSPENIQYNLNRHIGKVILKKCCKK